MLHKLFLMLLITMPAGESFASQYVCSASLSYVPSIQWNAGYWIQIQPGLNGAAVGQVRVVRNLSSGLPRVEIIQLKCQPGSNGAEYDCLERRFGMLRPELLAAQFYPNGWAQLYATPRDLWQPWMFGQIFCNRMF